MQPLRRSEFWEDTIKKAGKEANRLNVRVHYRPVGMLIVISFLTLTMLLDHGVPVYAAVLITMLVALLTVMFS